MFSTILNVLKDTVQHWVGKNGLRHIMCILCALSVRYGTLIDIGDLLLTMTKKRMTQGTNEHLLDLELFYRYLLGKNIDIFVDSGWYTIPSYEETQYLVIMDRYAQVPQP
jgi:hypothetical protein